MKKRLVFVFLLLVVMATYVLAERHNAGDAVLDSWAAIVEDDEYFEKDKGGILANQQIQGKRPLLAPIKKHREGYLVILSFTLPAEHLEEFEKQCKEQKDIIRFLVAKQAKKSKKPQGKGMRKNLVTSVASALESPVAKEQTDPQPTIAVIKEEKPERSNEEKINVQDIDEKLEEIFKKTK